MECAETKVSVAVPEHPANPVGKQRRGVVKIPDGSEQLHPLADELLKKLLGSKPETDKRVRVGCFLRPEFEVTKALAPRMCAAFHVLVEQLESRKIFFRTRQDSFEGGHFRSGYDRLYLKVREITIKPDGSDCPPFPAWGEHKDLNVPSGRLAFTLAQKSWFYDDTTQWIEDKKRPLERILTQIIAEICSYFRKATWERAKRRTEYKRQQEQWRKNLEEFRRTEVIRQQQQNEAAHAQSLSTATEARKKALVKAAALWRRFHEMEEFTVACEHWWRLNQSDTLTAEQTNWLQWARSVAAGLNPFEASYPDPVKDGPFNAADVPFGGPYPSARRFAAPPVQADDERNPNDHV